MKKAISRLSVIVALAAATIGCSGYSKLLKSGDRDKMYEAAIKYYDAGKYQKTQLLLEEVAPYFAGTEKEENVLYYTGASFYKQGDFESSAYVFDDFRRRWGRSPLIEEVEYMYAKGFFYSSPDPERDQTATMKAIVAVNEYLSRYPESPKKEVLENDLKELHQKLHDKAYINAKTYFNIERYRSAVVAIKNALDKYPESDHREELLFMAMKSSHMLARNSVESLQRDRYLNMMDDYYNFIAEFPDSRERREADRMQQEARDYLARFNDDAEQTTTTESKQEK